MATGAGAGGGAADMAVAIGLGSNLADPVHQVRHALGDLGDLPDTCLIRHSALYQSSPVGPQDQPDFINAVALLDTRLAPPSLLDLLQSLEQAAGRVRRRHWGERTLDLDILLWHDQCIDLPRLQVPHPQMCRRAFVLRPLLDLIPAATLPDGTRLQDHWMAVTDQPLRRLSCLKEDQLAQRTH